MLGDERLIEAVAARGKALVEPFHRHPALEAFASHYAAQPEDSEWILTDEGRFALTLGVGGSSSKRMAARRPALSV